MASRSRAGSGTSQPRDRTRSRQGGPPDRVAVGPVRAAGADGVHAAALLLLPLVEERREPLRGREDAVNSSPAARSTVPFSSTTVPRTSNTTARTSLSSIAPASVAEPVHPVQHRTLNRTTHDRPAGQTVPVLLTISTTHPAWRPPRPGLPAAQAPRPGAGVRAVVRHRDRALPRGRPTSAAPRRWSSTSTRSGWPAAGARNAPDFSLAQYVNDRPYAASSLLGVALGRRLQHRAQRPLRARARSWPTPRSRSRSSSRCCRAAAAPTSRTGSSSRSGWTVEAAPIPLDEAVPGVGRLALRATCG